MQCVVTTASLKVVCALFHDINFYGNSVALKIVPCNITFVRVAESSQGSRRPKSTALNQCKTCYMFFLVICCYLRPLRLGNSYVEDGLLLFLEWGRGTVFVQFFFFSSLFVSTILDLLVINPHNLSCTSVIRAHGLPF